MWLKSASYTLARSAFEHLGSHLRRFPSWVGLWSRSTLWGAIHSRPASSSVAAADCCRRHCCRSTLVPLFHGNEDAMDKGLRYSLASPPGPTQPVRFATLSTKRRTRLRRVIATRTLLARILRGQSLPPRAPACGPQINPSTRWLSAVDASQLPRARRG